MRYHLHDSNDQKIQIGNFRKLHEQIFGYEIDWSVFGCFDIVVANIHIGDIRDYTAIGHILMWRIALEDESLFAIAIIVWWMAWHPFPFLLIY